MPRSRQKPSLHIVTDESWRVVERRGDDYPKPTERSGKWLCFIGQDDAEVMWSEVAKATRQRRLGSRSSMRTPRSEYSGRVIEVHTYDWVDEADVRRVRSALRELGWISAIPYKADADTLAGVYNETGFRRVSKYYE